MTIPYLPLQRITAMHADEIHEAVSRVIDSGWYLRGEATERFEEQYARYIGTRHCIGVANGLDALTIMLRAYMELGMLTEDDEIIVPANTYIATILAITENRLTPVLVEPRLDTLQIDDALIEQAVTPRTRAIMIVHLYGCCAYTDRVGDICRRHNLLLLEDNAQAHGCKPTQALPEGGVLYSDATSVQGTPVYAKSIKHPSLWEGLGGLTGSLGHAAAHSFYPGKNLGALGDAGAVTTSDDRLAEAVRSIANYGSRRKYVFDYAGRNSRIDEIQAAVLSVKLRYLDADNERRRQIARHYAAHLRHPEVALPRQEGSVFHIFPVLSAHRDDLQAHLQRLGVGTNIHYPVPPHQQACYRQWRHLSLPVTERIHQQELSLPCHQAMTDEEVALVVEAVNQFAV